MAIKFSELRGLLKDTNINTVKMSDPAYNVQLAQCKKNNWNDITPYVTVVNFDVLHKLKMMNRLDVTCLLCPSEINLWISTNNKYDLYTNLDSYNFLFLYNDLYNLDTSLNNVIPSINKNKQLLSLFYVMNPTNGGALSEVDGVEKPYRGARIMNYGYYFGSKEKIPQNRLPFNNIPQIRKDFEDRQLVININPKIIVKKKDWNILIGLGYKPDDNFTFNSICDISFWLSYRNTESSYLMFHEDSFTGINVHTNYRYNAKYYFEEFDNRVIYQ